MRGSIEAGIGEDTIAKLERAAKARSTEADALSQKDYLLAGIYFLGYAVEALLGAAVFRLRGFGRNTPITDEVRKRAENSAKLQGLMSRNQHDILGWAKFLVSEREQQRGLYPGTFGVELVDRAKEVYELWRPKIRYRAFLQGLGLKDYETARNATDWMLRNYSRF